jgi:hypothetical protein
MAGVAAFLWHSEGARPTPIVAIPNSVVAVDPTTTAVVASIPVGDTPTDIVAGAGYVWELNSTNLTVSRINPRTRTADGPPFSVGVRPAALAAGSGALWIADADRNSILEIDPETGTPIGNPISLTRGEGTEHAAGNVSEISFGLNRIYAQAYAGLARVDPDSRHVKLRRAGIYEGNPYGPPLQKAIAAGKEGLWVCPRPEPTTRHHDRRRLGVGCRRRRKHALANQPDVRRSRPNVQRRHRPNRSSRRRRIRVDSRCRRHHHTHRPKRQAPQDALHRRDANFDYLRIRAPLDRGGLTAQSRRPPSARSDERRYEH